MLSTRETHLFVEWNAIKTPPPHKKKIGTNLKNFRYTFSYTNQENYWVYAVIMESKLYLFGLLYTYESPIHSVLYPFKVVDFILKLFIFSIEYTIFFLLLSKKFVHFQWNEITIQANISEFN